VVTDVQLLVQPLDAGIVRVEREGLVKDLRAKRLQGVDHSQQLQEVLLFNAAVTTVRAASACATRRRQGGMHHCRRADPGWQRQPAWMRW
jgi:hypothetical protein